MPAPQSPPGGRDGARPRGERAAAALAVLVLLAGSLAGLALGRAPLEGSAGAAGGAAPSSQDAAVAPPGAASPERVAALEDLLGQRARALAARDRSGWLRPLAAGRYAESQGEVFDRLAPVPVTSWRWRYRGPGASLGPGRVAELTGGRAPRPDEQPWVAHVSLVYRLAAGGQVRRDQYLTLAHDGSGWAVAGDGDGPTASDLWDLGPVSVAAGQRSLVLGTDVEDYPALADAASAAVDAVWGSGWPRTSVVEVPASQEQMAALLGRRDPAALDRVAAVTTGETLGGVGATTGDRVVVNPEGFATLSPEGREVVLTHELTHVATRHGASAAVPTWFSEGYADWVGYRGHGLAAPGLAAPLLDEVRGGGAGTSLASLPDEAAFDPVRGDVAAAYAGSWLAVDLLARRYGDDVVTALYRDVSAPPPGPDGPGPLRARPGTTPDARLDRALRARLGVGTTALTAQWRQRAERLAATAPATTAPATTAP